MKRILCLLAVLYFLPIQPIQAAEPPRLDYLGDPLPKGAVARMGTNRLRHAKDVWTIAYSPDGKTIASGGEDQVIRIWDAKTGKALRTLVGHERDVRYLTYAPDGKRLFSTGRDKTLRSWDMATGKQLSCSSCVDAWSYVAFSPDRKFLAVTGGYNGKIRIVDTETGKTLPGWDGEKGAGIEVAFSPDGKTLAVGSCDSDTSPNPVHFWDWRAGKRLHSIQCTKSSKKVWVFRLAYSPDGKMLATISGGTGNRSLHVWETATGKNIAELDPAGDYRRGLTFSPDGKLLAACGGVSFRVWNVATRKLVRSTKISHGITYAVAFSPDGKTLASGHQFGRICLWEPTGDSGPKPVCDFPCAEISLTQVFISPDGKALASVREDGNVRLWEVQTGKPMRVLKKGGDAKCGRVCTVDFSPDGKRIATGHESGVIVLWDRTTGQVIREIKATNGPVGASFTPDGKTLLSGGGDKVLCHWDVATGKKIRQEANAGPGGLSSPDRTMTASTSGGTSGTSLCDAATGKRLHFWENPKPLPALDPESIAFSPDGTLLGAASFDWVRICDAVSGQELFLVKGKPRSYDFFQALAFSPDGRILALGCGPKVLMWEPSTGKQLHEFEGHRGSTFFVAFTPDGKYLVSTGSDGTALVWDVSAFARHQPEKLSPQRLQTLWTEFRGESQPAYRALLALADDPKEAVPFLNKQLQVAKISDAIARLVADLDSKDFAVRDQATNELEKLGLQAEPALSRARAKKPSLEMSRRLDQLLDKLATAPDTIRMRRAVKLLGWINTPESRKVLEGLAAGEADSIQTREAKAALNRRARRSMASGGR